MYRLNTEKFIFKKTFLVFFRQDLQSYESPLIKHLINSISL